jgi:hypothetical protein
MNELDTLENAAVDHMNWESNKLNADGNMAFFGEAQGGPQSSGSSGPAILSAEWFKEPKNLALVGVGALALILLIMLVMKKD